jgi:hypothetical protein
MKFPPRGMPPVPFLVANQSRSACDWIATDLVFAIRSEHNSSKFGSPFLRLGEMRGETSTHVGRQRIEQIRNLF